MPNHITNVIKILDLGRHSEAEVRKALLDEKGFVDFNAIKPFPESLKGLEPDCDTADRAKCALGLMSFDGPQFFKNLSMSNAITAITTPVKPEKHEMLLRCIKAGMECGYVYWYDWNSDNWGTKWNAYGQSEHPAGTREFRFQTAWSHPEDLMVSLSKLIPDAQLQISYADEDMGSNCGEYTIKGGEIELSDIAPAFRDMTKGQQTKYLKFAFSILHPGDAPEKHGYDKDFSYSEELYEMHN